MSDDVIHPPDGAPSDAGEGLSPGPVGKPMPAPAQELSDAEILSRLESLIYSAFEPLTPARAKMLLAVDMRRIKKSFADLQAFYASRGIVLVEVAGGWQFRSNPSNAAVVRRLLAQRPVRLSRPSLETLAIVAYRQPITRPEIEDIRGVDSGGVMKLLLERGLIKILGKKEEPGRPIIYGTTAAFLELFGMKSLSDLPPLREFMELTDEHRDRLDAFDQMHGTAESSSEEGIETGRSDPGPREPLPATVPDPPPSDAPGADDAGFYSEVDDRADSDPSETK